MRKHRMNYKKAATAVLAGMMLSMAVAGSAFAATSKPAGPGTAAIKKAEEEAYWEEYWAQQNATEPTKP